MNRKVVYIIFGMILTVLIFLGIGYYTYLKVKTVDWVELMNAVHRSYEVSITYMKEDEWYDYDATYDSNLQKMFFELEESSKTINGNLGASFIQLMAQRSYYEDEIIRKYVNLEEVFKLQPELKEIFESSEEDFLCEFALDEKYLSSVYCENTNQLLSLDFYYN